MWVRMVSWQGGRKASFCVILRCALHCTACLCRALWQVRSPALATPLSTFFFFLLLEDPGWSGVQYRAHESTSLAPSLTKSG